MSINRITNAEGMFWTSTIIPLLMLGLFSIQHAIVPNVYQEKTVSFGAKPKFDQEPASETRADSGEDLFQSRCLEMDNANPMILYSDEHISLTTKTNLASRLEWRLSRFPNSLTATYPDNQFVVLRFLIAAVLQGLQLSLLNNTSLVTTQLIKEHNIGKDFALLSLFTPTLGCFMSVVGFMGEVDSAIKDEQNKASGYVLSVLTTITYWLIVMLMCLTIPFVRAILA